jgi:predicted O-linked N-acetylglucosamine transferase (SPINDLY family)
MFEGLLKRLKGQAPAAASGAANVAATEAAPSTTPAIRPDTAPAAPLAEHQQLFTSGNLPAAETAARAALRANPADVDAALTLCQVALARRRQPDAQRAIAQLRSLAPDSAAVDWQQGLLHLLAGRRDQAMAALQAAVTKDARLADAHHQLALLWQQRQEPARALQASQAAVRADPAHAHALQTLGELLIEASRAVEATVHLEAAVRADPRLHAAWSSLGRLRLDQGRFEGAAQALQHSLQLQPQQADVAYWLGHAEMGNGQAAAARAAYAQALKVDAQFLRARWALAMAQIEPVPPSEAVEAASRQSFAESLGALSNWVRTRAPAQAFEAVAVTQPYYLAYQEQPIRELLVPYGRLCAQAMAHWQKKAALLPAGAARPPGPAAGKPLRIGIVSAHLYDHSVWNAIVRGWVQHFDRQRGELHLLALGGRDDEQARFARSRASSFQMLNAGWQEAARTIAALKLDVLVYPELGMDSATGKLAALRLAPVQVASWGHPVTSGLPTIDHYVSAQAFEPADAADQYSEQLHLLPRLGCTPRRYGRAPARIDLAAAGIAPGTRVLLCAGTPFKYTPRHDALWVDVARSCAPCKLVFFRGQPGALSSRLEQRLRDAFESAGLAFDAHVTFVPWQSQEGFFGWLKAAHVFLDNPGFSGFNTVMQAVECGTPVVSLQGGSLRANFGAGVLRELGLGEWVAPDHAAYVQRVQRLCAEPALRAQVGQAMQQGGDRLFADQAASQAMQQLLETMAAAPRRE